MTTWTPDAVSLVLAIALGAGYLWALRRVPGWPLARSAAFFGVGLGSMLLVSVTFVGAYDDVLFWVRAVQVIVLLMITPFGLAMGAPLTLLREACENKAKLDRVLNGKVAHLLTYPPIGSVILLATPWLLYFTGWYEAILRNGGLDALSRLALVVIGFVYFYGRLQIDPMPRKYPHLIAVAITFVEVVFDAGLGLVLWLGPLVVAAAYYTALGRTWGPSLRMDQIIGAGVLWIGGDLAGLPFLAALFRRMISDDAKDAAKVDQQLDEAEEVQAEEEPTRLWWETNPELSERFRRS
ncbi:cytochrome c oxidase assembly protein [Fodinicola feengrottensis]|uniref:cytochrome c oxidase assembly protein n=1 Tax=Fodinicola feengrottensis TaxID=435914 RepID=UPI0031D2FEB4